jgi:hypothetical protein
MFHSGQNSSTRGNILSNYDIKSSIFGYPKNYETIYFLFHFVITQEEKNHCVLQWRHAYSWHTLHIDSGEGLQLLKMMFFSMNVFGYIP